MKLFAQQFCAATLCFGASVSAGAQFRPDFLPALYATMGTALFAAAVLGSLWSRLGTNTPPRPWRERAALGGAWAVAALGIAIAAIVFAQGTPSTRAWFVLVAGTFVLGAVGLTGFLCGVTFNFFAELRGKTPTAR